MVIHQAVGVADPVVSSDHFIQVEKEYGTVLIVAEYLTPRIPAGGNMIHSPRIFDS
jgi:hypothetical protein